MILALEGVFGRRRSTKTKTMTNARRNKFDVIFLIIYHAIVKFLFLIIYKHGNHIYSAIDAIH